MLIKLDDAIAKIEALWNNDPNDTDYLDGLQDSIKALRALPVSDGWEDIATYEGPDNEYLQVWCQCEDSGIRWTTAAHRLGNGQWFNDLEGYIPVKGYRPLPAPPTIE